MSNSISISMRLEDARRFYEAREWEAAYDAFAQVDADALLCGDDFERMSWAARWTGRYDAVVDALESAERAYIREGDKSSAARTLIHLAYFLHDHRQDTLTESTIARATELLDEIPECAVHGSGR